MEIKATLGDDNIVKERLDAFHARFNKAAKKEKRAVIISMSLVLALFISTFFYDFLLIVLYVGVMIELMVISHYSIKTSAAMNRLTGYIDGSSDTMIELTLSKAKKAFMKAIDEHKEQEAKKEEVKKPAPKKSVKK